MPAARKKPAEPAAEPAPAPAPAAFADTLVGALADAQAHFPPIAKSKTATVRVSEAKGGGSYSYKYADISDVLAAVRPVLGVRGLAIVQRTKHVDGRLMLLTELRHVSGEVLDSEVELSANPSSPQQFGGSLTYLRRYEAVTLLGIAAEEDTDAQHVEPTAAPSGYGQAAAPPAWAREADRATKAKALDALERVIGERDQAGAYLKALSAKLGVMPDGVAKWAAALPDWIEAAGRGGMLAELPPEPPAAAAAKQDAAAEQPDPPAPEDLPPGESRGTDKRPTPDLEGADHAPTAGPLPTEPEDLEAAEGEVAARIVARAEELGATLPVDADGVILAPGTAPAPDLAEVARTEGHAARVAIYRAMGCICPDPISPQGPTDDACPIVNHGIPF